MKSQILAVLLFCLVCPWLVARIFQMEGHRESLHENVPESRDSSRTAPIGSNFETAGQQVNYDGLSTKQINYLIP